MVTLSATVTTALPKLPAKVALPSNAAVTAPEPELTPERFALVVECNAVIAILPLPDAATVFVVAWAADNVRVLLFDTATVPKFVMATPVTSTVSFTVSALESTFIETGRSAVPSTRVVAAFKVKVTFDRSCELKSPPVVTKIAPPFKVTVLALNAVA